MEKVIIVTFSLVFGNSGKNRPAPCLQSAVIHITIRFMNLKCNFPVVLGPLAPSTTWTVRESGKKGAWECARRRVRMRLVGTLHQLNVRKITIHLRIVIFKKVKLQSYTYFIVCLMRKPLSCY